MGLYDLLADNYEDLFPLDASKVSFFRALGLRPGARFLDLGCATGELAYALAREGFTVTGLDLNQTMVRIAQARPNPGAPVTFLARTMLDLDGLGGFDAVACLGNTLPHLGSVDQVQAWMTEVRAHLTPGGTLVFQLLNYDQILADRTELLPLTRDVLVAALRAAGFHGIQSWANFEGLAWSRSAFSSVYAARATPRGAKGRSR